MSLPLGPLVRPFDFHEVVIMGLLMAIGVGFLFWLVAGYYERRGGFGKK